MSQNCVGVTILLGLVAVAALAAAFGAVDMSQGTGAAEAVNQTVASTDWRGSGRSFGEQIGAASVFAIDLMVRGPRAFH